MKPKNFPARKLRRRGRALARAFIRMAEAEGTPLNEHQIAAVYYRHIGKHLVDEARKVRTKKDRS